MKSPDRDIGLSDLLDAIQDQTRVMIALGPEFTSKTESARKLSELGIPASRISSLLNMPVNQVTSTIAKSRRKSTKEETGHDMPVLEEQTNEA